MEIQPQPIQRNGQTNRTSADTVALMVCKGFSGEIVRVVVSVHDTIETILPLIADQINYYSPDWEKIGLYNLTLDYEYRMDDTLAGCDTHDGDLVIMADGGTCHK